MDYSDGLPEPPGGLNERQKTVYKMRLGGYSLREIARAVGFSHETVREDFDAACRHLQRLEDQDVLVERQLAVGRLDAALAAIWPQVRAGRLQAVDRLIALEARRASLLGLDMPKRVEMTGRDGGAIETRIEDLRQRYTPEEAMQKAREMAQSVQRLTAMMAKTSQDGGNRN